MPLVQALKNHVLGRSSMLYKQFKLDNRRVRVFDANHATGSIFIHIPKTGGFSVAKDLYGVDPWHFTLADYAAICDPAEFFTFAVVRDPADRLYSMYNYLRGLPYTHHDLTGCQTAPDFAAFCRRWEADSGPGKHPFLLGQLDYLGYKDGSFGVDFVARMERLNEDYAAIRAKLGLAPQALPHLNKSKRADPVLPGDRALCRTLFTDEYAALGY